jgi:hypothetical protein
MPESVELKIVVEASLVRCFDEGASKRHLDCSATQEMTEFLAMVLNDSMYPLASRKADEQESHLSCRPKSYADPMF